MKARLLALVGACSALLPCRYSQADISDAGFLETQVLKTSNGMTAMAWAPDGSERLFLTRKNGQVLILEHGSLLVTPFATISPLVTAGECGLLGLAFDPRFLENGHVYFLVTVSATEQQIIRYTASGNLGGDKTIIVPGLPTRGGNHNGGALGFGADGKLYWAIGDNAGDRSGTRADLLSLASKVGRANPDGSAPQDNPFFDGDGPNNDYIWARGFRNPFTLAFQPDTGRLWLNVVGARYEQIFRPAAGDSGGWDQYEGNQPAGFLSPTITYDTNGAAARVITPTGAQRSSGVVTITTTPAHRLRPGAKVTIAGVADPSFDGTFKIVSADLLTFDYLQAGPNVASGGGTATPHVIGGAVTGGAFWDSSGVPAAYRGNFMFGDYNTGRMMRVQLDGNNEVSSIDEWGSNFVGITDMALAPDGDMYYMRVAGFVNRASYQFASQAVIVSPLNLRMAEAATAVFGVRLAVVPINTRSVTSQWFSGDSDVSIVEGQTLVFDSSNWSVPQRVVVSAAADPDSLEDLATLRVTSSGLGAHTVGVKVTDDDAFSAVVSPGALDVDEGATGELAVSLTQPPPAPFEVVVARTAGDTGLVVSAGASLGFDGSNWAVPQVVTVSANQDADADDGQSTLTISGAGLVSREIGVTIHDDDALAPSFSTEAVTTAIVGLPYVYDADAQGQPDPQYVLDAAPPGMTVDADTGVVSWTPEAELDGSVTLRASNGILPDAVQQFEIDVRADEPPTCTLTAPTPGATLAGSDAEFFGDVFDDVGVVRAEFLVDGLVVYDDVNDEGHYHIGGTHNLFDTTLLADGDHSLAMQGYDSSGQSCIAEVAIVVQNDEPSGSAGASSGPAGGAADGGAGPDGPAGAGTGAGGGAGGAPTDGGGSGLVEAGAPGAEEDPGQDDADADADGGCGCRVVSPSAGGWGFWLALSGAGVLLARRRRSLRQ